MHLDDYTCVLCASNIDETLLHLFFDCSFSRQVWHLLGINWDTILEPNEMLLQGRQSFGSKIFREVIMVAVWSIWCHRNRIIFNQATTCIVRWKTFFKEEMELVMLKVKPTVKVLLEEWICNINL